MALPTLPAADQKLLEQAKTCWQQGVEADEKQWQREKKALAMYAGDQWDAAVKAARAGQPAGNGMPPLPARPTLTINKLREPVRQVLNEERNSDMGIEIVPADDFEEIAGPINPKEIELREGLTRRIQRESDAADARTWGFSRATIAGRGDYRVLTRYLPGKTNDQEIFVERIYDQNSVMRDPAHQQPDGSDADWVIIGTDLPWDQYKAEYPFVGDDENPILTATDEDFRRMGEDAPEWFRQDGKTKAVRVVEYFYTVRTSKTLCTMADGSLFWKDELPEGSPKPVDTRPVVEKAIKWAKLDGVQVLERTDWLGPDMPVVKILGEELHPYDNERRAQGMVEPAQDSQVGFNAMVSKWVESVALTPPPIPQAAPAQVEPFKQWYEQRHTRALPYLPYEPVIINGVMLPPPSMMSSATDGTIQQLAMSVQMFAEGISATTGVDSQLAHLGHADPSLKSGKAIQALQAQSQHGTSGFLDNLKRSIRYEGQIINNLLYPIYGKKPGRLVRIVTGEGESQTVTIATATGQAPEGQPAPQVDPKAFVLTPDAHFNVIIKVTRSYDSRREQEASILGEMLAAQPQLMGVFGDLFFKNQDGPGHAEMAERAKVMLAPPVQQLLASKQSGQEIPPQVQAQVQSQQQQIQHAEQIMAGLEEELKSKRQDNETKVLIAQAEIDSKEKIAAAERETRLAVAEIGAKTKELELFYEERQRLGIQTQELSHEAAQAELARQHEEKLAGIKMGLEREKLKGRKRTVVTKSLNRGEDGAILGATEEHQEMDEPMNEEPSA